MPTPKGKPKAKPRRVVMEVVNNDACQCAQHRLTRVVLNRGWDKVPGWKKARITVEVIE